MVMIANFHPPESPVVHVEENVTVLLDKKNLGVGTLFISERTLNWQKEGFQGFSIEYFNITLHAVSKDKNVCERDCIYILTDSYLHFGHDAHIQRAGENDDETESEPDLSELVLIPDNNESLLSIYDTIKVCQALNPDPVDIEDDEEDDDDDDDNLFADAEEEMILEPENENGGDQVIDRLAERFSNTVDSLVRNGNDEDHFEDAD